jgi:hypothetical protein
VAGGVTDSRAFISAGAGTLDVPTRQTTRAVYGLARPDAKSIISTNPRDGGWAHAALTFTVAGLCSRKVRA